MFQDLRTRYDWPVKKAFVDWPIRLKGNKKRISGKSLSPLWAQNKDMGTASQTLLTDVKLRRLKAALFWLKDCPPQHFSQYIASWPLHL